ncbi:MAG TPA: Ig-like domain-containing protein [Verrucomicrobiae bacterium]|nr:Ig-like domain-containing protein [Verrucomicrobiae bacterium]
MSVAITSPAAGAKVHSGKNVKLQARIGSSGALISKVEYYCSGKAIGVSSASPYTVVWSKVPAGTYSITAVATDSNNFSGLSAPVSVRAE